jgi:hypothetical protein
VREGVGGMGVVKRKRGDEGYVVVHIEVRQVCLLILKPFTSLPFFLCIMRYINYYILGNV